jgi:hypothetical protein
MGLPTRREMVSRYAGLTGADPAAVQWWEVVVQQLHRRWVRGESTDPRMATIADRIPALIAAARHVRFEPPPLTVARQNYNRAVGAGIYNELYI